MRRTGSHTHQAQTGARSVRWRQSFELAGSSGSHSGRRRQTDLDGHLSPSSRSGWWRKIRSTYVSLATRESNSNAAPFRLISARRRHRKPRFECSDNNAFYPARRVPRPRARRDKSNEANPMEEARPFGVEPTANSLVESWSRLEMLSALAPT